MNKQIAILGANSEIAYDLILNFIEINSVKLFLFSRNPESIKNKFKNNKLKFCDYTEFNIFEYDVIINCIGAGDPSTVANLNDSIMEITLKYDSLILEYLNKHNDSLYIFLSSGAVYGESFDVPVTCNSKSIFTINSKKNENNYSVAKFVAEIKHRNIDKYPIIDIRIFNYFSATQSINSKFFIMDIVRAIKAKNILEVTSEDLTRDYIHPKDFFSLINCIIRNAKKNQPIDCYSKKPISKFELLKFAKDEFGLNYEISKAFIVNPTGAKLNYYSLNHSASIYGYAPMYSSIDSIEEGLRKLL